MTCKECSHIDISMYKPKEELGWCNVYQRCRRLTERACEQYISKQVAMEHIKTAKVNKIKRLRIVIEDQTLPRGRSKDK